MNTPHVWTYVDRRVVCAGCGMWHSNYDPADDYACQAIPDAPPAVRPCFTCGTPTYEETCLACEAAQRVACVPDDQPETYAARRQRIAAERNPVRPVFDWGCVPSQTVYAATDGQGWYTITWPQPDTRGEGIQRAVDRLSQVEHRIGAAKYQP